MQRIQRIRNHPLVQRYRREPLFRVQASLHAGLSVSLFCVALKAAGGLIYGSEWLFALAGYYLLLALLRAALLGYVLQRRLGEDVRGEWRRYRLCGGILALMTQALAVMVFLMVHQGNAFTYPGVMIYAAAFYAFYAIIAAAVNFVRFRRQKSPVLLAVRAVSLAAAMVSMLALQTGLLAQFATEEEAGFCLLMNSLTGIAVCALVLAMATHMIWRANRVLREKG